MPEHQLLGVINKQGALVSTITTSSAVEVVREHYRDCTVEPWENWTDEQKATYNEWVRPARDASIRELTGLDPETLR